MENLIRDNRKNCSRCKYRTKIGNSMACNYSAIEGHSRIFQDGKLAYDPEYCDKFQKGAQIIQRKDAVYLRSESDEYMDYKFTKCRKERSTYDYKYHEKHKRR